MSVYHGHDVQGLVSDTDELICTRVSWHPTYSLLAMVSHTETDANGYVSVCHDQGELINDITKHRSLPVQDIKWNPEKKLLAAGWQDGGITVSNIGSLEVTDPVRSHVSPITTITWSTKGGHLLTSDKTGLLLVWRLESKGQLHPTPVYHNQLSAEPTHCVLVGRQSSSRVPQPQFMSEDSITSFIPVKSGILYYLTAKGQCVESDKIKGGFKYLLYSDENTMLVGITEELILIVFNIDGRGVANRVFEGKLSAQGTINGAVWCPEGTLATCSEELSIRFWDCVTEENSILSVKESLSWSEDLAISDISYSSNSGLLAISSNTGEVALWSLDTDVSPSEGWSHVTTFTTEKNISCIKWNNNRNLLAINMGSSLKILSRHASVAVYSNGLSAVQISPNEICVKLFATDTLFIVKSDLSVKGLAITMEHLVIWNDNAVAVHSINFDKCFSRQIASFQSENCFAAIHELNVFTIEDKKLVIRNTQGVVKHRIPTGGGEFNDYSICSLHVSGRNLVLVLKQGAIRVWDLSRREPKLTYEKNISPLIPGFREAIQASSNSNTTSIGITIVKDDHSSVLVVVGVPPESDIVKTLDFSKISDSTSDHLCIPETLATNVQEEQLSMAEQLKHGDILRCHWDATDPRLCVLELERDLRLKRTNSRRNSKQGPESLLLSIFVTDDFEVILHNSFHMDTKYSKSLGCDVPFMYFLKERLNLNSSQLNSSGGSDTLSSHPVDKSPLTDFIGLEDCDTQAIRAITGFSYYSLIGNMDEAFKSIKAVKSQKVWESLARTCIKTRRLDVALVCLGNMGNARAAKAVRESSDIAEHDARLAVLATQLGMLDEAENLYKSSGRSDLLNLFYQSCGKWQKAIEVAEVSDRLNLKLTYFNFGKHSEAIGEIKPALKSFERADVPMEIMSMLSNEPNYPTELEDYILSNKNSEVRHFWAEYLESIDDLEGAMLEYESCGDVHSQVRLLVLLEELDRAVEVVDETRNEAAAYYLARQLSQSDKLPDIRTAIRLFTLARCYNPAIQLAKENGLDMDLMNLALMSSREDKLEVAKYYENHSETQDNAILLYHKAGELSKSLELCFQYQQYEVLHVVAEELSEGCNPDTLKKVAEYFVQQEQFDKAVDLYIRSNKASEALNLCSLHNIIINEDLAERMTPQKTEDESPEQVKMRTEFLLDLGDCLVDQEQWHLAAKKYTQAGDRVKAMKALLKSGDTEKMLYFANVSRQKEIYVLVANYLQSLNWKDSPNIMKTIIGFYTKGRALESLANFYNSCAQVEIDEYQNYDKAYGALCEAVKCLKKAISKEPPSNPSITDLEEKVEFFQYRAMLIKKFSETRNMYSSDPDTCAQKCHELLNDPKIDVALRTGDIYALLITYYSHKQEYKQAYDMIEEMQSRNPGVNIQFYVDPHVLASVYNGRGTGPPPNMENNQLELEDDEEVESGDEIVEEFEPEP